MRLGDVEILPLSDGFFRLDGGAMFGVVPKPLWERRAPADERNRIRLGLRPLVVRTGAHTVLIDAGIGGKMGPKETQIYGIDRARGLDRALHEAGLSADDIDIVLASHLHFDHAGGFTERVGGEVRPTFRRARYLIRRGEWDDATHPHERNRASYLADDFLPLERAGVVDFIEHDGAVLPGISVWRTGGHTWHHQLIRIESAGRTAVFTADLMPTAAHVDAPWIMAYDLYPMDTLAFKREFLREAIAGEYVIFFEHDPAMAAGVIRSHDGRLTVEAVATDAPGL
jgi:glyoxylase-like metal-dependent hydrolase (beta-lactamase superfamily II)